MPDSQANSRLLVVDDEEGPRKSLDLIFKNRFDVALASSGEEAIRLSKATTFSVAIVDLRMEGISGIEVLRECKRASPFTEVIILTAYETLETARQALTYGASEYLSKPFNIDHIRSVAERCRRRYNFMTQREMEIRGEVKKAKNEFLSILSHELITPMNGVVGFLNLLMESTLDEEQRDYLQRISTSSQRMLEQVNDILEYAQIVARPDATSHEIFNPYTVLVEAARMREPPTLHVTVEIQTSATLPEFVYGPKCEIQTILLKLIDNALKFTPRGKVILSADPVYTDGELDKLYFTVRDTGIGVEAELIEKNLIYESFYQADSSTTREYDGLGLGLSVCDQLCRKIGAEFEVESNPGVGSCFGFTVPISRGERN